MADIVLIQPKTTPLRELSCLPLGLLAISRLLTEEGYKIKIINQIINNRWRLDLQAELKKNPICVGISAMIGNSILDGIAASKLVKEKSNIPVVWGGPHPSIIPRQTLENEYIDIVCEGEGDITFYELIKTLEKNKPLEKVKGIWYKENRKIKRNEKRSMADLNKLPDLPYDILEMNKYKFTTWYQEKTFTINVETSRGCPFHCTYCYNCNLFPHWRGLNSEKVVELLKNLNEKYNVRSFHLQDDNFFVNKKRTNEIMKVILKEKLDIVMGFQGLRVDTLCRMKKDEFDLLYKAGGRHFNFGLETGSPRLLKLIKKGTTIEQAYAINERLAKYPDIYPHYNVMTGIPTETIDEMLMTVNMLVRLKKENPNIEPGFFLFISWPKTEIYDLAIKSGFIPPKSLEEWGSIKWRLGLDEKYSRFRPWLTKEFIEMYKKVLMMVDSTDYSSKARTSNFFLRTIANLYSPIAKFRLNNACYSCMPEYIAAKQITTIVRDWDHY